MGACTHSHPQPHAHTYPQASRSSGVNVEVVRGEAQGWSLWAVQCTHWKALAGHGIVQGSAHTCGILEGTCRA